MTYTHLQARITRLERALKECAAEWRSPPCTVSEGAIYLYQEFVRRAELAQAALAKGEDHAV